MAKGEISMQNIEQRLSREEIKVRHVSILGIEVETDNEMLLKQLAEPDYSVHPISGPTLMEPIGPLHLDICHYDQSQRE